MDTKFVTDMYDTIHFGLCSKDFPHCNFITDIPPLLSKVMNEGNSQHGPFINGYLDNYLIKINPWNIKFQNASLAKFINGDNIQGMSLGRTREAFMKLSDHLHLDISKAKVTRVDLGRNLMMKWPPSNYLSSFGEHVRYRRYPINENILYKNSGRELLFYDKTKEQLQKRQIIPDMFMNRNILRYEMRFKNHLEREFKINKLTVGNLYEEKFYIVILNRWKQEYLNIKKMSNKISEIEPTTSTRVLFMELAAIATREIGSEQVIGMIGKWQNIGLISKKQACDHRKAIREAIQKEFKNNGNELIEELDQKIKESTRYFI